LLIIDDVVCSFGRLGAWFGWHTIGVEPDLVAVAKGITSGYIPLSASIIGDRVWQIMKTHAAEIGNFGHGFTTSGHPVAAAAALANIEVIENDNLLSAAKESGAYLLASLRSAYRYDVHVGDIRGAGLLIGVELVADQESRRRFNPSQAVAVEVANICLGMGLVVRALPDQDVIAFAPPLNITHSQIDQVINRFRLAVARCLHAMGL
jgi:L-2,4-diaminobutyrate transaminase